MSSSISVRDIGSVANLDITVPDEGGLVILAGANGNGNPQEVTA